MINAATISFEMRRIRMRAVRAVVYV